MFDSARLVGRRAGHRRAGEIVEGLDVVDVRPDPGPELGHRARDGHSIEARPPHDMRVDGRDEVTLGREVAIDRRDRDAGIARHGGDRDGRDALGHHADGRIEDARSRLRRSLRSKLAAVLACRRIGDTSHIVNVRRVSTCLLRFPGETYEPIFRQRVGRTSRSTDPACSTAHTWKSNAPSTDGRR